MPFEYSYPKIFVLFGVYYYVKRRREVGFVNNLKKKMSMFSIFSNVSYYVKKK